MRALKFSADLWVERLESLTIPFHATLDNRGSVSAGT